DISLERELHQLKQERATWEPGYLQSLLGDKPTPPPDTAWTFPPAASADAPLEPTEVVAEPETTHPLAVPDVPDFDATVAMGTMSEPTAPVADSDATVVLTPPAECVAGTGALVVMDVGEDEITDEMAALLQAVQPDTPEPTPPPVAQRPSWSERLNRVFARRQAENGAAAGRLTVREEAVTDPWSETFPEPHHPMRTQRGLQQPILGFAIGVTAATLGTLGVLFFLNQRRPVQVTPPQLSVPAPPPESAVLPSPNPSPVPNLARKELPDLSAVPTASPKASPAPSPTPLFYYVVTDYKNEQSLIEAQKVVPEAFVWQFPVGVKVQLAAFEVRNQAEQFVADLKAKGVNARVYP
ncbi:MAG: hypothetical protein Q6K90_05995, partial [Gloeomargarita sp. HHBFW_bins_162]